MKRLYYRRALAFADELGMSPLEAHCHAGLSNLKLGQGQPRLAREELCAAIELYDTMKMTHWSVPAQASLAKIANSSMVS